MREVLTRLCPTCGRTLIARLDTDGRGHHRESWPACICTRPKPPRVKRTPAWRKNVDDARRLACICQLCELPVVGKPKVALYCEAHRAEKRAESTDRHLAKVGNKNGRAYYWRNPEKMRAKERRRYTKNPAERERRNEYKRLWRKLNRDKVRAQKERSALRNFRDPQPGVKRWRAEVEAGLRKPKPARRNAEGQRLCSTPRCRSVMDGPAKKCDRCKRREARAAAEKLTEIRRAA